MMFSAVTISSWLVLQYAGVDSIVTAELDTGREMAKKTRKSMNMRCDDLRERVLELSVSCIFSHQTSDFGVSG